MKKLFSFLLLFAIMLCTAAAVMAQEVAMEVTSPASLLSIFETPAALVAAVLVIVAFFRGLFMEDNVLSKTEKLELQIISWGVGFVLAMLGWLLGFGFLDGLTWYMAAAWGLGTSLAANGVADTKIIQAILSIFKKKS